MIAHDDAASLGGEDEPSLSAEAVARLVDGELRGDGAARVRRAAPLEAASADALSFLASERYRGAFATSRAGVVLVPPELASLEGAPATRIVVARPQEALLSVLPVLYPSPPRTSGVHPTAIIGRGARLGREVSIGAYSVIGEACVLGDRVTIGPHCDVGRGVAIGDDCALLSHVTLYPGTLLGRRVRLHAGVRVGSDGFGYLPSGDGPRKIPHVGRAVIEDDVEIGANTTVDRGSIGDTVIGAGTKIDNLVQIAHNVRIGKLCLIAAQVGIAGSVEILDGCVLGGQVGIADHLRIGPKVTLAAQSGVMGDLTTPGIYFGYPARPRREMLRMLGALSRLPELLRDLERASGSEET